MLNHGAYAKSKGGYRVDFGKLIQEEKATGKTSDVRRDPPFTGSNYGTPHESPALSEDKTKASEFADVGRGLLFVFPSSFFQCVCYFIDSFYGLLQPIEMKRNV